ncbi:MAG: hypothetical protein AAFY42_12920 [Pseudomonadota bacterium]
MVSITADQWPSRTIWIVTPLRKALLHHAFDFAAILRGNIIGFIRQVLQLGSNPPGRLSGSSFAPIFVTMPFKWHAAAYAMAHIIETIPFDLSAIWFVMPDATPDTRYN